MRRLLALLCAAALALPGAARADGAGFRTFTGHGGPVKSVVVSPDGETLATAGFDNSVGLWPLAGEGMRWLEGHEAAVNTAIFVSGGRIASGGDDFDVIVWEAGSGRPLHRLEGHRGKVMGLAASPDGTRLLSASWDGSLRLWDLATGAEVLRRDDHEGAVSAVAFSPNGRHAYSAGADGRLLEWDTESWRVTRRLAAHGFGINVLALDTAGAWLAYGAVDGGTRILSLADGAELADLTLDRRPILALAIAQGGDRLAVGDGEGYIMVVETAGWRISHDFRAALHGPIWALAFTASGAGLIAGGIADEAFLWPLARAEEMPRMAETARAFHADPDTMPNGERQFLRKCSVCHSLTEDRDRRAGPPLGGLFGRPAGSVAGYVYSEAVANSGIVWSEETIDALFDLGPDHYIPGTKMPMQRIAAARDRADLIAFLRRETSLGE